jgi:hypothetical protein
MTVVTTVSLCYPSTLNPLFHIRLLIFNSTVYISTVGFIYLLIL